MNYNFFKILFQLLIIIGIAYIIFFQQPKTTHRETVYRDSIIKIVYDSTVYQPQTIAQTIIKPTETYYITQGENDTQNLCDSIRRYNPVSESDSIRIVADLWVRGKLEKYSTTYQWKKPVIIEKTYNNYIYPDGILLGAGIKYPLAAGITAGYKYKNYYFTGTYYNDRTVIVGAAYQFKSRGSFYTKRPGPGRANLE